MKKKPIQEIEYDYYVHSIGEGGEGAYKAIIPAFDDTVVYGDTLEELEDGIRFTINSEIEERKRLQKAIPEPEKNTKFSGKVLIRVSPFLHEKMVLEAKAHGTSLNKYIEEQLR